MITNFETLTDELTDFERNTLLPIVVRGLSMKVGKDSMITQAEACEKIEQKRGYKISGVRWRKLINVIRREGLIKNLVSTSRGYYVATKREEVIKNVQSLQDRINSIEAVKNALIRQIKETFDNE